MEWIDYHLHTNHSFDSKASMEEVCREAIRKGVAEVCFTEHYSVNTKLPTYGHMNFEDYFYSIQQCRVKFKNEIIIKAGIELCEPHLMKDTYTDKLSGIELDFILGSVHNINEEKLRSYMYHKTPEEVYNDFFEEVYRLVSYSDIDVIAHFDLMKRYGMTSIGNYNFLKHRDIIERILTKAIERNIGLEINTSGLRNEKINEAFPGMDILAMYKSLGGEILTIGSDSHDAKSVGGHFKEARKIAKEAGFQYIFKFDKRKPSKFVI
ncbi:histidinol-phosphatase HisJ family protein [Salimicrobium album]|uniref:Histidinol-phosphatase n=1 Tax=Salimicrobium album TaxID=50717 RepID=A0A1H3H737_9BACI|nr:histidinol-phosphatase HisJ family protein [Salimicrobium album]SDY11296.1 histidinol-phosphatase (PHP family) [Salimicrobium album]